MFNIRKVTGFTLIEIMLAVFIISVGVVPVINLFLASSKAVEKSGEILEAVICAQDIIDRAKSDSFLWNHPKLSINIPDSNYPEFLIPKNFADKYKASATLSIERAPGHTVLGTGFNEENLFQITVSINWNENQRPRSSRLVTYRANTNSFNLKTSARF